MTPANFEGDGDMTPEAALIAAILAILAGTPVIEPEAVRINGQGVEVRQ